MEVREKEKNKKAWLGLWQSICMMTVSKVDGGGACLDFLYAARLASMLLLLCKSTTSMVHLLCPYPRGGAPTVTTRPGLSKNHRYSRSIMQQALGLCGRITCLPRVYV